MIANKLKPDDEIRVIAPSRNLTEVWHVAHHHAVDFWHKEGFNLTFSKNSCEIGKFHSSSFRDKSDNPRNPAISHNYVLHEAPEHQSGSLRVWPA